MRAIHVSFVALAVLTILAEETFGSESPRFERRINPFLDSIGKRSASSERIERRINPFLDSIGKRDAQPERVKRAINPFLDSMGKRAVNPFLDSIGKRDEPLLPLSKRYFDSLAGQSLGKRSPPPFAQYDFLY